ncbi:MAG: copper amine oxidase N-terminal domain-containing protein, partial [Oscillospiraceae bacterium]|nr:copper amine oxidase N-terminal domain-containing protein [Oscillospiraceae bacterium]
MRKFSLKSCVAGFLAAMLAVATMTTALATQGSRQITVDYNDIKIEIDGREIKPMDANGNIVEPFISDGTTYLPVRAVAGAVGYAVRWDGDRNTVVLENIDGYKEAIRKDLLRMSYFFTYVMGKNYSIRGDIAAMHAMGNLCNDIYYDKYPGNRQEMHGHAVRWLENFPKSIEFLDLYLSDINAWIEGFGPAATFYEKEYEDLVKCRDYLFDIYQAERRFYAKFSDNINEAVVASAREQNLYDMMDLEGEVFDASIEMQKIVYERLLALIEEML